MHCFLFLRWITFCSDCRRQVFFYLVDKKSDRVRQVVVLYSKDYMELVWVVSELVVLNEWSSYRGGSFSRFDCRTAQQDIFLKDMMFTIAFCRQIKSKFHIPKVSEFVFFFYLGFHSQTFTNHRTAGEAGGGECIKIDHEISVKL